MKFDEYSISDLLDLIEEKQKTWSPIRFFFTMIKYMKETNEKLFDLNEEIKQLKKDKK